ncbi:MAG TPA: M20/M25/M40 family metallo-hydrolase [Methylomirabilota bacterium]|nr:M20/M25/M40 family metallo-hydrolase [Methylomirabilota bacterium]
MRRRSLTLLLLAVALLGSTAVAQVRPFVAPTPTALAEAVAALTTPEMEGRRSGTPGGERAAALIADWLRAAGLQPAGDGGSFFQSFLISTGTGLGPSNAMHIAGGASLVVGTDWIPHGGSAQGDVDAEVVYVGHGLSDDYADVDANGRIVLALSGAPSQLGSRVPRVEKVVAAREHGARALLLIDDTLPELASTSAPAPILSATVRRSVADALLPAGTTVAMLESAPRRMALGRRARVRIALEHAEVRGKNVVGIVPGRDPALRDETIVVGAHYDHLGRVGDEVHPGADDNASGTAVVTALARGFADAGGAPRTLVFALFGAEELGLIGSGHYVKQPSRPLDRTVAMVNFDMVGRLRDGRLTVGGVDSAAGLHEIVGGAATAESLTVTPRPSPFGPSDHARFYRAGVPVLFFHTGSHADYHRPSDTADKIDAPGMARVAAMAVRVVERLATAPRPAYATVTPPARQRRTGTNAFLGVHGGADAEGARLAGVVPGTAADRAGLREGDVVIRLAGARLASFDDLRAALRKRHAGERVDVVFVRNGEQRSVSAILE